VKKGITAKRGKNLLNKDNFKAFSSAVWECLEIIRALYCALERYLTGARIGIIAYIEQECIISRGYCVFVTKSVVQ
jgi:hypothetical protein